MKLTFRVIAILSFIIAIAWMIYSPGFEPLLAFFTGIATLILSFVGGEKETETLDQRNRRILLNHVENFWVKGVLEKSLHGAAMLELGIKEDPEAVTYPWAIKKEATGETISAGTSMMEIFETIGTGRSLLILGAPGSGKTTMLLELARQLIERARQNADEPIPMVFNLASWTEKLSLADWLAQELNNIYYVPRKTAPDWVKGNKLLLLLDGLDEVRQENRTKCVDAINQFRKEHGLTSLAVCSRSQDYEELKIKLAFDGAIEVQPLTQKQVNEFFNRFGKEMAGLKQVLKKDSALRETAETPLFLSIMAMAYRDRQDVEIFVSQDENTQRKHLFDNYIERMFERPRSKNAPFKKNDVLRWLSWLGDRMIEHNQVLYIFENMQPDWLATNSGNRVYRSLYRIIVLAIIVLSIGLVFGPISGWKVGLIAGLIFGIIGAINSTTMNDQKIIMLDKIKWSWKIAWSWKLTQKILIIAFIVSLFLGTIIGTSIVFIGKASLELIILPISYLSIVLIMVVLAGFGSAQAEETKYPGQKLKKTHLNAVIWGLIGALSIGILTWLFSWLRFGQDGKLNTGLNIGLIFGMTVGWLVFGNALIQHYSLRFVLAQHQLLPWNLIPFLDHSVDILFLRRVGGGYIFIHHLLMEHFAAMYKEQKSSVIASER